MPPAEHPLARRIHDGVLQLVGTALMKAELAEQLARMGRHDEVSGALVELRATLEETAVELRAIMRELKRQAA